VTPDTAVHPVTAVPVASALPEIVDRLTVYVINGDPLDAIQLNKHVVPVDPVDVNDPGNVGLEGVNADNSAVAVTLELEEFAVVIK
jgi:hypothetical protein